MRSQTRASGDGREHDLTADETMSGGTGHGGRQYAGLWPRVLAFTVDYLPVAAWLALVTAAGAVVNWAAPIVTAFLFSRPLSGQATAFVLVTLPVTLYARGGASGGSAAKALLTQELGQTG